MFQQIRLPTEVSDDVDEDPTGNKALWDRGLLNGASQKVCSYVSVIMLFIYTISRKSFIKSLLCIMWI